MNRTTHIIPLFITALLLMSPSLLFAQGAIELNSRVEMEVIQTNEQGEKVKIMVPAAKVLPGETVIYTNTVSNNGDEPAEAVVINNPVPDHTNYLAGTAFGDAKTTFSADHGASYAAEGEVTISGEDGKPRLALPKEYTNIRWRLNKVLQPGESGEIGFRVRLQ